MCPTTAASCIRSNRPIFPIDLTAGQAAQLSEVLEYIHIRIRNLLNSVRTEGKGERMSLEMREWQNLADLQSRLAEYLRDVTNPNRDVGGNCEW